LSVLGRFPEYDEPGRKAHISAPYLIDPSQFMLGEPVARALGETGSNDNVEIGG
jgi:hypothetical protein